MQQRYQPGTFCKRRHPLGARRGCNMCRALALQRQRPQRGGTAGQGGQPPGGRADKAKKPLVPPKLRAQPLRCSLDPSRAPCCHSGTATEGGGLFCRKSVHRQVQPNKSDRLICQVRGSYPRISCQQKSKWIVGSPRGILLFNPVVPVASIPGGFRFRRDLFPRPTVHVACPIQPALYCNASRAGGTSCGGTKGDPCSTPASPARRGTTTRVVFRASARAPVRPGNWSAPSDPSDG